MADSLSTKVFDVEPVRGNIFDCNGNLLATSMPIYDIIIDAVAPKDEEFETGIDSLSMGLSVIFKDKSKDSYKKLITNLRQRKERYHVLHKKASFKQMRRVQQLPILRLGKYKGGLIVENKNRREKPFDYLAERTIGFNVSNIAPVGVEGAFNTELSGKPGKRVVQRVSGGAWIPVNDEEQIEAQNGLDIITSIDGKEIKDVTALQEIAATMEAGNTLSVKLTRDGKSYDVSVKIPKKVKKANI
jgi:cell division protein FtsI (penicillin-binding protein 3)